MVGRCWGLVRGNCQESEKYEWDKNASWELKADCYIMHVRYYKENPLGEIIEKATAVGSQYLPW